MSMLEILSLKKEAVFTRKLLFVSAQQGSDNIE